MQNLKKSVEVINPLGQSKVVLICEHASSYIPPEFGDLGLGHDARISHIAWDPGALAVAQGLSQLLDATLVAGGVSRLIYDCNRPPFAVDAMPSRSEIFEISGNQNLSDADRARRVEMVYEPFRAAVVKQLQSVNDPIIVTIHSFTPIYHGTQRIVEIGVLYDADTRLADAMMSSPMRPRDYIVMRNEPYGPQHGVTHTLREHALPNEHANVMIEIRNDLIQTPAQQAEIAAVMADWISDSINNIAGQ